MIMGRLKTGALIPCTLVTSQAFRVDGWGKAVLLEVF